MNLCLRDCELPVRLRFERALSEEELERFCVENDPLRVERDANGELIVISPTWTEGGWLESEVYGDLSQWSRLDGRGRACGSTTGFMLPDSSIRAADAAWLSWDRWNVLTPEARKGYARTCPEFVIEIRSPSDRLSSLQEKMVSWVSNGAELAWLVDPQRKVIEVYRPSGEVEEYESPTSVQGEGPVRGFELVLSRIW